MALSYRSFEWVPMHCPNCVVHYDVTPAEFKAANGVLHCQECHFRLNEMRYEPEDDPFDEYSPMEHRYTDFSYDFGDDRDDRGNRFRD